MPTFTPENKALPSWRTVLDTLASVMMIGAAITLVVVGWNLRNGRWPSGTEAPLPSEPIPLAGATLKGDMSASVVLTVFTDLQCPFCAQFARETLPELDRQYVRTGHVLIAFRHFPLRIHSDAVNAAQSAECAGQQGRFWDMHDRLFLEPSHLEQERLLQHATELTLNVSEFARCVSLESKEKVTADIALGRALGITGTPGFVVGIRQANNLVRVTKRISGARPFEDFARVLNQLIGH